ncbi:hypothetical protein J7T55_014796 [Diaporthe amygdali]|uniref:uncharacterized protein n=1 Tax=Phomopsis amygdali TaxID=1214568 RepID=UPI0022FE8EA6|nr:uncharacterized protein J7T55_014796 [Diaporthe amygdali]KAJ0109994.1 hypothetical protein J7T55_014796 [Diaporthe amygdali]
MIAVIDYSVKEMLPTLPKTNFGGGMLVEVGPPRQPLFVERASGISCPINQAASIYAFKREMMVRDVWLPNSSLSASKCRGGLDRLCRIQLSKPSSPWAARVVAGLTAPAFVQRGGVLRDHKWMCMLLFRHLYRMEQQQQQGRSMNASDDGEKVRALLRAAKTPADAAPVVTHLFANRLARADSLMDVELLFWFSSEIRAGVSVLQILGSSTIAQLGAVAAARSEHLHGRDLAA